jgi:hypothetical protein
VHRGLGAPRGGGERLGDVRRRADVRVAAPEVDERLSLGSRGGRDAREQAREVLLRQAFDSLR